MPLEYRGKIMSNWPSKKELERVRNKLDKAVASYLLPDNASAVDRTKDL